MKVYNKVRFVSWEIYTGPYFDPATGAKSYSGIGLGQDLRIDVYGQYCDMLARLAFTKDAIVRAFNAVSEEEKGQKESDTLKVFMAPEFLYRGAGGAYLHDLIWGWNGIHADLGGIENWSGLMGSLKQFVADDKYADWVFVFGTAVSAAFKTISLGNNKTAYDFNSRSIVYNTSLIQAGGTAMAQEKTRVSQKLLKSHIDFIKRSQYFYDGYIRHIRPTTEPFELPGNVEDETVEGGALFEFKHLLLGSGENKRPIKFGLEICLDHGASGEEIAKNTYRYNFGRLRNFGERRGGAYKVDLQLVPSGGMTLVPDSFWLNDETSYAFNCDGLGGQNNYGCHTQIASGNAGIYQTFDGVGAASHKVINEVQIFQGGQLFNEFTMWDGGLPPNAQTRLGGSGHVRLFQPLNL